MFKSMICGATMLMAVLALTSSCCDGYDDYNRYPYNCGLSISLRIYSAHDSLVDSIINLENNKPISFIQFSQLCPQDSGYCSYLLPLDPSRPKSSFAIFYRSLHVDTLVVSHQFEEKYEKCSGDYFEVKSRNLVSSTFLDPTIINQGECYIISIAK